MSGRIIPVTLGKGRGFPGVGPLWSLMVDLGTVMMPLGVLQGFFPMQGSNPGLPHCRQILYQLSHKGSP